VRGRSATATGGGGGGHGGCRGPGRGKGRREVDEWSIWLTTPPTARRTRATETETDRTAEMMRNLQRFSRNRAPPEPRFLQENAWVIKELSATSFNITHADLVGDRLTRSSRWSAPPSRPWRGRRDDARPLGLAHGLGGMKPASGLESRTSGEVLPRGRSIEGVLWGAFVFFLSGPRSRGRRGWPSRDWNSKSSAASRRSI